MTSQFPNMTSSLNLFDVVLFLLSSLVISPSFMSIPSLVLELMTIFFYKGLTRNPEIGNILFWVLLNIWRLGQVMETKFGTSVSSRMLLNAAKFQGYSFYRFWVIKGKPTWEGGVKLPPSPPPPRLGLSNFLTENLNEICGDIWCCQKWCSDREIIAKCSFLYIPHCTWSVIKPCGKQWNC